MVLTIGDIMIPLSLMAVILPLAVYFLIVGLLNSRSRPQVLTGGEDSLLLAGAMSALFWPAVVVNFGVPVLAAILAGGVALAGVCLALHRPRSWVIYNLPADQVEHLLGPLLTALGASRGSHAGEWHFASGASVILDRFPLFRNVSIRFRGEDESLRKRLEAAILTAMTTARTDTTPLAMMLLLLAVVMLACPLMIIAPQADEIARHIAELFQ
jgi:hypothetical protein